MPSISELRRLVLDPDACTVDEAIDLLQTTRYTIYSLIARRHVRVIGRIGTTAILSRESLLAYGRKHPNLGRKFIARLSKQAEEADAAWEERWKHEGDDDADDDV